MRILLTGFGSFGDVISNPTERLVRWFEQRGFPGHELSAMALPVAYRTAPRMVTDAINQQASLGAPFDLVWMLGVAGGSAAWRVERQGINLNGAGPDAEGFQPERAIVPNGPDALAATVPVPVLVSDLNRAGIPAIESLTAGDYLCNHVLYSTLWHLSVDHQAVMAGFLHVPPDSETFGPGAPANNSVTFAEQVAAVEITLETLSRL